MFDNYSDPENALGCLQEVPLLSLLLCLYLAQFSFYRRNSLKIPFTLVQYVLSFYCMPQIGKDGKTILTQNLCHQGLYHFIERKKTNEDNAIAYHVAYQRS